MRMGFLLCGLVWSVSLFAAEDCVRKLGEIEMLPSGREAPADFEELAKRAVVLSNIARDLGIAVPPHYLEFLPPGQMLALASLGRYPVGHFIDGADLSRGLAGAAGVLEFVTPGCPTCRSFYQDTTNLQHQTSIIAHVIGHNDFAATSMFQTIRGGDPITASLKLYELMEELNQIVDEDEVAQWYQELTSLTALQDVARNTFQHPDEFRFEPDATERIIHTKTSGLDSQNPYRKHRHPRAPTPSIIQFIVRNLPPETPTWKIRMAELFEEMNRVYGYYSATKYTNEGWATLMMELLVDHSPYKTHEDVLQYHDLLQGVAGRANLSNPYWLGREAWRRVRERFHERAEIKGLERVARDKAFIKYAREEIISNMTDYQFLRFALDHVWLQRNNVFLYRPAEPHEQNPDIQMPPGTEQKIILSTDPDRVVTELVKGIVDRRFQRPRLFLENARAFGARVFHLRHELTRDVTWPEEILGIPLDLTKAAQASFVLSRVMDQEVVLDTVNMVQKEATKEHQPPLPHPAFARFMPPATPSEPEYEFEKIRIRVSPTGKLWVYRMPDHDSLTLDEHELLPIWTDLLQEAIGVYQADQALNYNKSLDRIDREYFLPAVREVIGSSFSPRPDQLSHAPTTGRALEQYDRILRKRINEAMKNVFSGKQTVKMTAKGVRVRALPLIPQFDFDRKAFQSILGRLPAQPVDSIRLAALEGNEILSYAPTILAADEDVGMTGRGAKNSKHVGDLVLGPARGGGQGKPRDASEDAKDLEEVEIPMEVYQEFLNEFIELPNLRPREGDIEIMELLREGGERKRYGELLTARMVPQALTLGMLSARKAGIDPKSLSRHEILKRGFSLMGPDDNITKAYEPYPEPKARALVVMLLDLSGSMQGWPEEALKRFVFNLELALKARYSDITFKFVAMDTKGYVFDTIGDLVKASLGGGTSYAVGFEHSLRTLQEFNNYDKFFFGGGDTMDWAAHTPRALGIFGEIMKETQYSAYIHVNAFPGSDSELRQGLKAMLEPEEFAGYAEMNEGPGAEYNALRQLFGKKK